MSLGPVFYVEMLTVGRRRRYVLTRVLYGLVLLFLMGVCYLTVFDRSYLPPLQQQAEFAFSFFVAFSWVQLIGVLFLTPAMVAGTIAGEHERRTIDYLLTTSLNDSEITLGKFAARMLAIGVQLASGVPILAIAMMLGGIAPEQLLRSFLISLASLLSVGGLCLALSTRARTSREAIVRAYVLLTAWMIIPPIIWGILEISGVRFFNEAARIATELNPAYFLGGAIFSPGMTLVELPYFLAAHLGVAVVCAVSSVFGLRRFYVKQAGKAPPQPRKKKERSPRRRTFIPAYSMLWKEIVAGRGAIRLGLLGRIAALGLYALALWGLGAVVWEQFDSGYRDRDAPHVFGMIAVPMIASLCVLLVAGRAAGSVTAEREQDTWTTLVSTPLSGREIVWAKFCASVYSVRYWYYLVAAAWLLCLLITPEFVWAVPFLILVHLAVMALTAAIGVLCSLNSTTSLRAMGTALAIVVLVLSIAPLFFAVTVRSEEMIGFSLPVLLGGVHFVLWEAARSSLGGHDEKFLAILTAASILYAVAALVCYSFAVVNFDALIGRTAARTDFVPATSETSTETDDEKNEPSMTDAAAEPEQRS